MSPSKAGKQECMLVSRKDFTGAVVKATSEALAIPGSVKSSAPRVVSVVICAGGCR